MQATYSKIILIFTAMALLGCPQPNQSLPANLKVHSAKSSDLDSGAANPAVYSYGGTDTQAAARNMLVVFLPGTSGDAAGYQHFMKTVLGMGYHGISLGYHNNEAMGNLAAGDMAEYEKLRKEIIWGDQDYSSHITVNEPNALIPRLKAFLGHLKTQYPGEAWDQFLTAGGDPQWSKILISGFSQGAGHAAFLAKTYPVVRLVMLGGVVDGKMDYLDNPGAPLGSADWISSGTWQTGTDKIRWFVSTKDDFFPAIKENMKTLGFDPENNLAGNALESANVDTGSAPWGSKPILLTDLPASGNGHPYVVEDSVTPVVNGVPRFKAVWQTLFE